MTIGVEDRLADINGKLEDIKEVLWRNGKSTTFTVSDEYDVKVLSSAHDILNALDDIKQHVRGIWKHTDLTGKDAYDVVDEIYGYICDQCSELDRSLI